MESISPIRRTVLTLLCLGLFAIPSAGHDGEDDHDHAPPKVSDEVTYRPPANPDRIVLTWASDPATTQAVTWRTDTTVTEAFVEYAVAGDGPLFVSSAEQITARTAPFTSDLGIAHMHTVNMTGLNPNTKYAYRVGDGNNWSEWSHFSTASQSPDPFTFVYFGDAQNDIKSHWSRVVREAFKDAPRAAFLLHAGDLVNRADSDGEWGEWFDSQGFISRTMSCIAVPGNHEYTKVVDESGEETARQLTGHWQPTFAFPENGPQNAREAVYWIDYQGARIIALNSNEDQEAQTAWLEEVLSSNLQPWTVITFHHPIYSSKAGRDNPELRDLWQPIFDKYRVDLVLTGHDHTYARSRLMRHADEIAQNDKPVGDENVATGVRQQSEEGGTVYVVSVSGPKMYELDRRPFMQRVAEDTQLYQVISVDGDELRFEARTATGRPYDAFTLKKRAGQTNELIERIPETPERGREEGAKAAAVAPRRDDGVPLADSTLQLTNPQAQDQDDLCIWKDQTDPSRSTIIASDKSANRLFVYDLSGSLLQAVDIPKPGNIDIRSHFPLGGKEVDLVVVNQRTDGYRLCAFRVDRDSRELVRVDRGDLMTGPNYGGCLYRSLAADRFYAVITSEDADAEQYELMDDGTGHVVGKLVRHWPIGKSEGAVADDARGKLFIAEEDKGIWEMDAEPQGSSKAELIVEVGHAGIVGDLEGVTIASADGVSYLLFSDQGANTIHVLALDGSNTTHRFAIDAVQGTDGIDITLDPLGERFPRGFFACHTDIDGNATCPIMVTPMERVLTAIGVE